MSPKMNTSNLSIVSWSAGMAANRKSRHVRPPQEDVRPGLHQGAELQVGVLGQKAIHQRAVLGPQRAFDIQHADARLGDGRDGRTLVVLDDFLALDRRHADRVGVPAFHRGPKLEDDLLRAFDVVQGQFGLGDLPAVFVEIRLDDPAAEPDGVDRPGDPRHVIQHHAVRAVDAGHWMSRNEGLLRRLAPTPTQCTVMPSLRATSSGSPAALWMPSERRITAATSAGGSSFGAAATHGPARWPCRSA